jgi:hypothetical protein
MIISIAIALALQTATGAAPDYFPLDVGDKWTYTCDTDGVIDDITYEVLKPDKIGKTEASVLEVTEGAESNTLYYLSEPDTIWLLASDKSNPYGHPRTALRLTGQWHGDYMDQFAVNEDSSAKPIGKKNVLGQDRDIIEVVTKLKIGSNKSVMTVLKRSEYAKGVGLIRMEVDQSYEKHKAHRVLTLKTFEHGKESH